MQTTQPIAVTLYDPVNGQHIQTWEFVDQTAITIGRDVQSDVSVGHPLVSRKHATLSFRDGQWHGTSSGRHGTLVEGDVVSEFKVDEELSLQLGSGGPVLKLSVVHTEPLEPESSMDEDEHATMILDASVLQGLKVNEDEKNKEVDSITDNDHFARLKEQAQRLRGRRGDTKD